MIYRVWIERRIDRDQLYNGSKGRCGEGSSVGESTARELVTCCMTDGTTVCCCVARTLGLQFLWMGIPGRGRTSAAVMEVHRHHHSGIALANFVCAQVPTIRFELTTLWPKLWNDPLGLLLFLFTRRPFHIYPILIHDTMVTTLRPTNTNVPRIRDRRTRKDVVGSRKRGLLIRLAFPIHEVCFCGGVQGF
jgi:hypothetical protein